MPLGQYGHGIVTRFVLETIATIHPFKQVPSSLRSFQFESSFSSSCKQRSTHETCRPTWSNGKLFRKNLFVALEALCRHIDRREPRRVWQQMHRTTVGALRSHLTMKEASCGSIIHRFHGDFGWDPMLALQPPGGWNKRIGDLPACVVRIRIRFFFVFVFMELARRIVFAQASSPWDPPSRRSRSSLVLPSTSLPVISISPRALLVPARPGRSRRGSAGGRDGSYLSS